MTQEGISAPGDSQSFPREARVTDPNEIRALFRRGRRRKTRHLDVFVSASPFPRSRVGVVVAKPRAKTAPGRRGARGAAVQRNRLKRRLREIARRELLPELGLQGCQVDVLLRTRPEAYGATFAELREELGAVRRWMCSSGG